MKNITISLCRLVFIAFGVVVLISTAQAEQKVIQQEKISFEKCLKVISTSESKLSIAPDITDFSNQKRAAVFTLVDGTLTITCDGVKGVVIVTTSANQ